MKLYGGWIRSVVKLLSFIFVYLDFRLRVVYLFILDINRWYCVQENRNRRMFSFLSHSIWKKNKQTRYDNSWFRFFDTWNSWILWNLEYKYLTMIIQELLIQRYELRYCNIVLRKIQNIQTIYTIFEIILRYLEELSKSIFL